eukprot:m.249626 g.249626  ORF g.249626 m.249626 type:complete len:1164 (+) comp40306_c0_seq20:82-3573(+)
MADGLSSTLKHFNTLVKAISELRPPVDLKKLLDDLSETVKSVAPKLQDGSTSKEEVVSVSEILATANKRLGKIKVPLKKKRTPSDSDIDSLEKLRDDLRNKAFRYISATESGVSASSQIKTKTANDFWMKFFPKDVEVEWDRWMSEYLSFTGGKRLSASEEKIVKEVIGFAGGKFVAAGKLDEACKYFGFPFKKVKCCREMNCLCMKYVARKYCAKKNETCTDCEHNSDRHFLVERENESDSKSSARGSMHIKEKAGLITTGSSFSRLQKFILKGDIEAVRNELKDITDINERDKKNQTALHTAAGYAENPEIVRILLQNGASWDVFDGKGAAPVHLAARTGLLANVKVLVEADRENVNLRDKTDKEAKPLHYACEEDRLEIIAYLNRDVGADINETTEDGDSCLFTAAVYDNPKATDLAIELGADPTLRNEMDEAPLDVAAREGSVGTILAIARKAPDTVEAEDSFGDKPLSRCTNAESVGVFVKLGTDVNHRNKEGKTALHAFAADPTLEEVTRELLKYGADPDAADQDGCTPVHVASRRNNSSALTALSEAGADINATDKEGNTPLLVALDRKFENISEELVDKGAKVTGSNRSGLTALHYACRNGYGRLTQKLVAEGAVVEAKDGVGKTPLHYAVMKDIKIAKKLAESGANMYIRDAKGDTPLEMSYRNGQCLKRLTTEEIELLNFTMASKDDLATPPGKTFPANCFADGPGISEDGHVNTRYSFTVFSCDELEKLRSEGGDFVQITAKAPGQPDIVATVDKESDASGSLVCHDAGNGTYPVTYEFSFSGRHEFHIQVNGGVVSGSPYAVDLSGSETASAPFIREAQYSVNHYSSQEIEFASSEGVGEVDLAIVCDTTGSMEKEIVQAQALMQDLVDAVRNEDLCTDLRIAIIAYRDHPPEEETYVTKVWPLTGDIAAVKEAINSLSAGGGGDVPEAISDALHEVYCLNWDEVDRPHAVRLAVLIGDAPPHGLKNCTYKDAFPFPKGCPLGHNWLVIAEKCRSKYISVVTVQVRQSTWTEKSFASIAKSSGGQCTRIGENNSEIINLIKMQVHLHLDKHLTECKISDEIIRMPLFGSLDNRINKVVQEMAYKGITVRRQQTLNDTAVLKTHSLTAEDVTSAIATFKTFSRLTGTVRDRKLTDWLGKQLYALKKITEGTV